MNTVLLVEDNDELSLLLKDFLTAEGYSATIAENGEKALELFEKELPQLVVLDVMLPKLDGFAVCKKIRESSNTPIIIVSARADKDDKLSGLMLGADDYIEKPYDIDILLAKIKGIFLRRYENDIILSGDLKIDRKQRTAALGDTLLPLTAKEFELLTLLVENKGKTLSKDIIFNKIWGLDSFSEQQTLTVHIKWLRQKIESDPKNPKHLLTVWGVGYRFE